MSYNYNSSNELTSTSTGSYTFDNNGNTLTDASGKSYTWDLENRLVQAVVQGTGTVTFKYDPLGRRIQKSGPLGTTNYLYDGRNLLEEMDSSGNVLARYTQGPGIDQPLSQFRSATTSYYEADGPGSITSLTSTSGTTAATYTYDAFGNLSASTGTLTNPFRYTSRELDSETGLYFYRARFYDPQTGRFISGDPIMFDGGDNFYTYANGNPVMAKDPLGLDAFSGDDFWKAWRHYCDGSGTPWSVSFSSVNWGNTESKIRDRIKGLVGNACIDLTVPVTFDLAAQTAGEDAGIIGRHVVKVSGTLKINCDCSWSFTGDMSSKLGYDPYDFDPSNRGVTGETKVWIGRHRCPNSGKPFNINLTGSKGLGFSGKIGGTPTCCKK